MAHQSHGGMDITEQKRTFAGFLRVGTVLAATIVVLLIILAIVGI